MDTQFINQPKPTLFNAIAWMTLASGIVNLIWGLVAVASLWWTIICIPLLILPTILGIFEVIYAAKLLSNPPQAVQPSTTLAVLEIVCVLAFNFFSVVVGILSLVFYNDVTVKEYFARLNGMPSPLEPVTPVVPAPAPEPEAPIVAPEEITPLEEPPAPAPEDPPQKPKRPRKVAGK